jgi:hypothetical protein
VEVHRALKSAGQGQGHRYSLGQWEKREGYIESGHLQVDNKRAERAIKPFVIGRKNRMINRGGDAGRLQSKISQARFPNKLPYRDGCFAPG